MSKAQILGRFLILAATYCGLWICRGALLLLIRVAGNDAQTLGGAVRLLLRLLHSAIEWLGKVSDLAGACFDAAESETGPAVAPDDTESFEMFQTREDWLAAIARSRLTVLREDALEEEEDRRVLTICRFIPGEHAGNTDCWCSPLILSADAANFDAQIERFELRH